ncbi:MAG: DUF3883 domain-containing protein [Bdellovibrionales bacterium]|nr:DUF3883 domain-containing protein [Bdellovibrionales bacterium]
MPSKKEILRVREARNNRSLADAILSEWWPNSEVLKRAAAFALHDIAIAHSLASGSWEVTLLADGLVRVNVGPVAVLDLYAGLDGMCAVYATEAISPGRIPHEKTRYGRYDAIPNFKGRAWRVRILDLPRLPRQFVQSHHDLITRAARARTVSAWKASHSPAVVAALADAAGVADMTPAYALSPQDIENSSNDVPPFEPPDPEIEKLAIAEATRRLRAEGWTVASREREPGLGYDLHCTRKGGERHVEVKGSAGPPKGFQMQRSQYLRAQADPNFELIYVSEIRGSRLRVGRHRGADVFKEYLAEPMTFACTPRK